MKKRTVRTFSTGATRNTDEGKIDPEAALSPLVLEAYCSYIREHRLQGSREARGDDNWQKGIPIASYMKSLLRHVLEAWRAYRNNEPMKEALFAVMFNTMGMLHENLKRENVVIPTSTKTIKRPESEQEWLEFHENMRRSSLPNEDDYRDLVLQEQGGIIVPQYDPKTS